MNRKNKLSDEKRIAKAMVDVKYYAESLDTEEARAMLSVLGLFGLPNKHPIPRFEGAVHRVATISRLAKTGDVSQEAVASAMIWLGKVNIIDVDYLEDEHEMFVLLDIPRLEALAEQNRRDLGL